MIVGNRLLDIIPQFELASIQPYLKKVALEKDSVLMDEAGAGGYLYFPLTGLISCMACTETGQQLEVYAAGRHDFVGPMQLWKSGQRFRAKVQLAGEAMALDVREFLRLFHRIASFREALFTYIGGLLANVAQRVCCSQFHEARQRVSLWLALASAISNRTELDCTHQSLSEAIGARRATVTTTLGELERAGAISSRRGRITIIDRAILHAQACECLANLLPAEQPTASHTTF